MNIGQAWVNEAGGFQFSESEKHKNYRLAVLAFEKAADRYHDRPDIASGGLFAAGSAYQQQSLDAEYDQGVTHKAIDAFSDFIALYPNDERVPQAREKIKTMKVEQALGNMKIARYYEKLGKLDGAKNYYNEVKELAPGTESAAIALQKIDELQRQIDEEKAPVTKP